MSVERWDSEGEFFQNPDGPMICFKDYAVLEAQRDALAVLFRVRTESDDRSILDDMDVAATALNNRYGELGFGLAGRISLFCEKARAALAAAKKGNGK